MRALILRLLGVSGGCRCGLCGSGEAMKRLLCFLWAVVYRKWLKDSRVVRVKGWRTAVVDDRWGRRVVVSPCFWWFR